MMFHTVFVIFVMLSSSSKKINFSNAATLLNFCLLDISFWERDLYIFIICVALFKNSIFVRLKNCAKVLNKALISEYVFFFEFTESAFFSFSTCIFHFEIFFLELFLNRFQISANKFSIQSAPPMHQKNSFYIKGILSFFLKLNEFQHISLSWISTHRFLIRY